MTVSRRTQHGKKTGIPKDRCEQIHPVNIIIGISLMKKVFPPKAGSNSHKIPVFVLRIPETQLQLHLISQGPRDSIEKMWSIAYMTMFMEC